MVSLPLVRPTGLEPAAFRVGAALEYCGEISALRKSFKNLNRQLCLATIFSQKFQPDIKGVEKVTSNQCIPCIIERYAKQVTHLAGRH